MSEAYPPYQFKWLGSVYIYPDQSTFYRMMAIAFAVSIAGLMLLALFGMHELVGWLVLLTGNVIGLYVLEAGYRRGKAST